MKGMPVTALLLAITAATLNTESVLRGGCDAGEEQIAVLPAGQRVEVRSALSGSGGSCYKVVADLGGKQVSGYVPSKAVAGAGAFEEARRSARDIGGAAGAPEAKAATAAAVVKAGRDHPATRAWRLIEANQPAEALRLLEQDLRRYPVDPYLHAVAGMAFYRMDNLEQAMLHWKESIAIEPNPGIEAMIRRAERERTADKGSERMVGNRVVLRYERATVPEPLAKSMLQVLDDEYTRISFQLGCRANEKVTAVASSRESYFQATQAAEWSGGLYDGRIHVPVSDSRQVSAETRRTFAHELVHACLHEIGKWPAWLHEGLAQKYSGQTLAPQYRAAIEAMIKTRQAPKLSQLGQNWSRMSTQNARAAYLLALYAAEKLVEEKANTGIGNVLRNPLDFPRVEAELERNLGL
ncbi:MAG: hypothetical protein IANPNBLG_02587 [Bryobacteraceae bacterium]|nr:hypothetical protein [Bryobacteraceae bacterium]